MSTINYYYFKATFLILGLFMSTSAYGQSRLDSADYNIQLKISGSRSSGIFNRNAFAFGAEKHLHQGKWTFHNSLSYRYTTFSGIQLENNWYDLFSVFFYPTEQKNGYFLAFYHYDNNLLFRVNNRHRLGAGLGSELIKNDHVFLRLGGGFGYESTLYNGEMFTNSELDFALRQNGLFLFQMNNDYTLLEKRLILKLNVFYMQSLKETTDFDIWFRPSLVYQISKRISVFVNYDYRYEHVHLEELPAANDILIYGFNISISNPK